eukprot:4280065-Pleurochrysis_carterae.AAC.1
MRSSTCSGPTWMQRTHLSLRLTARPRTCPGERTALASGSEGNPMRSTRSNNACISRTCRRMTRS